MVEGSTGGKGDLHVGLLQDTSILEVATPDSAVLVSA